VQLVLLVLLLAHARIVIRAGALLAQLHILLQNLRVRGAQLLSAWEALWIEYGLRRQAWEVEQRGSWSVLDLGAQHCGLQNCGKRGGHG
jgi:hypothetical protein